MGNAGGGSSEEEEEEQDSSNHDDDDNNASAIERTPSSADLGRRLFRKGTGNPNAPSLDRLETKQCADCTEPSCTTLSWVSMQYGTTVCVQCAGAHRSLGTTAVRSLRLDEWTEDQVDSVARMGGNASINEQLEWHVPIPKPGPLSTGEERRQYVRAKYVNRAFDKSKGLPRLAPLPSAAAGARPPRNKLKNAARPASFAQGRLELIGTLDVDIVETKDLRRPRFLSRHLLGAYRIVASLGTQKLESPKCTNTREIKLPAPFKFSWDGTSALHLDLFMGKTHHLAEADVALGFLCASDQSEVVLKWVDLHFTHGIMSAMMNAATHHHFSPQQQQQQQANGAADSSNVAGRVCLSFTFTDLR
jgi:hypothetical protein